MVSIVNPLGNNRQDKGAFNPPALNVGTNSVVTSGRPLAPAMNAESLYGTIGRQGEQAGLDYWNNEIATRGIDAVRQSFAAAGQNTDAITTAVNSGFYDTGYQTGDTGYQAGGIINPSAYAQNLGADANVLNTNYDMYDTRGQAAADAARSGEPRIGLLGSEDALRAGLNAGVTAVTQGVNTGRADIGTGVNTGRADIGAGVNTGRADLGAGINYFNNYTGQGNAALNLMGAQSGAQGQAAQQAAFNNYNMSPEQQYLREQGERSVLRNAAATGGLGGGNVQQELQRQAMGLAQQDFANQYNRLGGLSDLGMQGSAAQAGLQSELGNMSYQGGNALGNMSYGGGQALGTLAYKGGSEVGNMAYGTGNTVAAGRTRAGELIGQNVNNTASALSALINQQGAGVGDTVGAGSGNIATILQTAGTQMGLSQQQIGQLLAGVQTSMGAQVSGLPKVGANSGGSKMDNLMKAGQTAAQIYSFSDKRLKTNIVKVGVIGRHNLYTWDWTEKGSEIADPQQPRIGVMAQEAMKLNPEAVVMGDHGYLQVKYSELT